jgi:hypothetical protein
VTTCRSCGAAIRWLKIVPGGKSMPVDNEPHAEGNIIPGLGGTATVLSGAVLLAVRERKPDEPLYRSHFATCPDAEAWRSKR